MAIVILVLFCLSLILLNFRYVNSAPPSSRVPVSPVSLLVSLCKVAGESVCRHSDCFHPTDKIDDAVVVEKEWGWIEEINLTYVVVRIWDLRRLVLPITYFTENAFQNWTRNNAQILGSVFLYVDYSMPLALREHFEKSSMRRGSGIAKLRYCR